jgi:hypothetical protein
MEPIKPILNQEIFRRNFRIVQFNKIKELQPQETTFLLKGKYIKITYSREIDSENYLFNFSVNNQINRIVTVGKNNCKEDHVHGKESCISKVWLDNDVGILVYPVNKIYDIDGDGKIGEDPLEIDPEHQVDNDGDGKINEDPYEYYWDYSNWNTDSLKIIVFIVQKLAPGQGRPE